MKKQWVLVADGSRAKILKRENHSLIHAFPTYHAADMVSPLDKDSKRLGRVKESHETLKHTHSPHQDYKDAGKKEFVRKISGIINGNLNEYDHLVLIAPAERLGEIRGYLQGSVKEKITREINKDLVKAPLEEVYRYATELPDS
ncbi:MAG: host attachment protein [Alphaproteobacteria bacterium]|nr:host attachment protein [Alphaproteobacteria bacterium]